MIRILSLKVKIEENDLKKKICQYLNIKEDELIEYHIVRQSLDARKKSQIYYVYRIDVLVHNEKKVFNQNKKRVMMTSEEGYQYPQYGKQELKRRPVIIGFGPSGMFAGLLLAEMGLKPIIYERGEKIESRRKSVQDFWENRKLNPESNIQFGEGGAGTFSDGKLTTRLKDVRSQYVLNHFVENGAPEEILTVHNPHIGTDILVDVVKNIRQKIIDLGGEIHFEARFHDFSIKEHRIDKIYINNQEISVDDVVIAIGHSARDTFKLFYEKGLTLESKPFAVGVRIEHPQVLINQAQYGEKYANYPKLGAAEYKLTHRATNGKSVYTFCMCPGGMVVPSSSEYDTVVVNGMSEYKRDQLNANSALVCAVNKKDFNSEHPLAGMDFQSKLEKKAFELGGMNYNAPVQKVNDFLHNLPTKELGQIKPSYRIGVTLTNLHPLFPAHISQALEEAIIGMNHKLQGFSLDDAILTGVETRTSSPVRIVRDKTTFESVDVMGLYPTGEGAGYAGGIMSSAMDGMKVAERIINKYR